MARRGRPSKSCVTITTAIALAFCMRIWMTGVFGLIDAASMEGEWIKVDALIVGHNDTTFASSDDDAETYFCARVEFTSHFGENVTAISNTNCVLDALAITVGSYIPILYNPAYPNEFIEQDVLETELVSLKIMVGVGITVSLILSGVLCMLLNRHNHRHRPSMYMQDAFETSGAPTESPEERKEKILSKLYTVTVPENTSNMLASSIRSMSKLDSSVEKTKEPTEDSEAAHNNNEEIPNTDENDTSESNAGDSSQPESSRHQAASTISFLSSWIRPNHDAECCICLDHYEPGEVICASKSEECSHVFHKECLMDWMMKNNNRCPLCRVDFMKEDDLEA